MLKVKLSSNKRLNGFSYLFTGPCWRMLRVSSLQRSCASLVTRAAQEKGNRGYSLLLPDMESTPLRLKAYWLLHYIDLFAAGGMSDEGISFRY